jgi:hypothetical protein
MDESGTHTGSPVVPVGAYIAKPTRWRDWTKEWNRLKKPIKVVHAVDCANQYGEFKDWDRPTRAAFSKKMIPVIPKHIPMGVAIGIHMEAFEQAMAKHPELRPLFGTPYTACFQWVVQTILNKMEDYGDNQQMRFFTSATTLLRTHASPLNGLRRIGRLIANRFL